MCLNFLFIFEEFEIIAAIKTYENNLIMQNKRLIIIGLITAILLLIPFISMQFTDEVNWTLIDFVVAGVMLFGTGLLCDFALRSIKKIHYRIAVCAAILLAFLLIWAELAVGIF